MLGSDYSYSGMNLVRQCFVAAIRLAQGVALAQAYKRSSMAELCLKHSVCEEAIFDNMTAII